MDWNWVAALMVVGGLVAAILVEVPLLALGYRNDPAMLLIAIAIVVAIFGGVALFVAQTIIGIAREW